jgi:hypothetical protein
MARTSIICALSIELLAEPSGSYYSRFDENFLKIWGLKTFVNLRPKRSFSSVESRFVASYICTPSSTVHVQFSFLRKKKFQNLILAGWLDSCRLCWTIHTRAIGKRVRSSSRVGSQQSDKIGRIFAYWAIVFFGQFSENYISSPHFLDTFLRGYCYASILTKMHWATFWASFFTNSSGHPASQVHHERQKKSSPPLFLVGPTQR